MTVQAPSAAQAPRSRTARSDRSPRRRAVEAVAFVGVWIAAGYLLPLSSEGYLLLGIPLTIAFQLLVRRRPLHELFVAGAAGFHWDRRGLVLAIGLAVVPAAYVVGAVRDQQWTLAGWYLAAVVGAFCAAFAFRAGGLRNALRSAALPIAVGATGFAVVYSVAHLVTGAPISVAEGLVALVKYTALYLPATFLLEEVAFRGALDAHVHPVGAGRGWGSAVLVSALWGLWHLPVSHQLPLPLQATQLVAVHVLLGVPLSFAWRRSRNLAGPALAHGFNDAVRNAFMLGL